MNVARTNFWWPVYTLTEREVVRFLRQRTRLVGALGQPLIFWILFGTGLRGTFRGPSGESFQEYFLPGVAVMIVLFTAIFSTITVIEDRREGFLQGVLAAPVARSAIVMGKLCGGTILAVFQTLLFLGLGQLLGFIGLVPAFETGINVSNGIPVLAFLILLSFALTGLGYLLAWPMDSVHGFHAVMSVVLMPMWLLSGAFFPPGDSVWMAWVIRLNPLTYGVAGLRRILSTSPEALGALPSAEVCWGVTLLFGAACVAIAVWQTNRPLRINVK